MNDLLFFIFYSLANQSVFLDWLIIFSADQFGVFMGLMAIFFLFFYTDGFFDCKKPFLQFKNKVKEIFFVLFPGFFAWVVVSILKYFISSPRPFLYFKDVSPLFLHGGFDSFPSGHAAFFSALAVSFLFKHKRMGVIYIFVALIISLARIASGIHFPIDILVGWGVGITISLIFNNFFKK
ncbi:MAG: phosphatase PAP2 family protein [Candidatus Pacebacteria bacterium]|jgi:undecaprenyl-diphosphatase|nr:phosphatase PAP2 family protein [Candidatus Paceibacterota bacterium]